MLGNATYLIVSHDRHFIDQTADFVFEIEHRKLTVYTGNYSAYREKKEMNRAIQEQHFIQQQRKIAMVEEQMAQLGDWSEKAHRESTKKGGRERILANEGEEEGCPDPLETHAVGGGTREGSDREAGRGSCC